MRLLKLLAMTGRRCSGAWLVVLGTAVACVASARADIPSFVDYHATWSGGSWTINHNPLGYDTPVWQVNHLDLKVDNVAVPDWDKEVWLEVEWSTPPPGSVPGISMTQPGTGVTDQVTAPTADGDGFTWHWHIDPQPAEEWLKFPNTNFFDLQNINSIEVGTYCSTKTIHKPEILYGHLQGVENVYECGPTSATNSFAYLERAFPDVYGRKLIPDIPEEPDYGDKELEEVAKILAGSDYMNMGWYNEDFILGKKKYIENKAPDTTLFGAQMGDVWSHAEPKPDWVQDDTFPTWNWLYDQLVSCEDIEIGLDPVGTGDGHWLTLTSFEWLDDDDTILEKGEAKFDYIDPYDGLWHESLVWLDGTKLRMEWLGNDYLIDVAVSESIPEPATLCLLGLGALLLRRRKRS